jgi:ATP-dependent RNA helicase RhlE
VINFDVPLVPEDYIHRVGRTGRAEATGEAFTFVAPDEAGDLARIERVVGRKLPRVVVPDFDYTARPQIRLEVPIAERIAEIRARKAEERARGRAKAERKAAHPGGGGRAGSGSARSHPGAPRPHAAPAKPHAGPARPHGAAPRPGVASARAEAGDRGRPSDAQQPGGPRRQRRRRRP